MSSGAASVALTKCHNMRLAECKYTGKKITYIHLSVPPVHVIYECGISGSNKMSEEKYGFLQISECPLIGNVCNILIHVLYV